uniref:Uncharacterized protein n=1 Tax=Chelydra serpentina TaxID=8475 RepID=A0A8C3TAP6_CHESE
MAKRGFTCLLQIISEIGLPVQKRE